VSGVARRRHPVSRGSTSTARSPTPAAGTLVFSDGEHELTIASVGLPCVYCDAYWPPLQIALSGDVLAWSYAIADDSAPHVRSSAYGYTRLVAEQRCDQ